MGRVFLAHDPVLDRDVAIKLLRDDLGLPPEHREALLVRMRQEARASAGVTHPNLVELHDMGEDPELGLFLVFEYVDGPTLTQRLERGPLAAEGVARLARELGGALTTAHDAGILHRDIKPENVILARNGAKITDFGIARIPDSTLTRDGGLLGTPAYSAPEANAHGHFSPASDQFSLAATLWEALSGRRAFPGEDALAVASRIATEEPPRIAAVCDVPSQVDLIFARALSKNPSARYSSCEEFGRALADVLELKRRAAQPTLPDERHLQALAAEASPPRSGLAPLLLGVALGVAGGLAGAQYWATSGPLVAPSASAADEASSAAAPADLERPDPRRRVAPTAKVKERSPTTDELPDAGARGDAAAPQADAGAARHPAPDAAVVDAARPEALP